MAYDHYQDSNGVRWTIAPQTGLSWFMIAYVAQDEPLGYDPPPPDIEYRTPPPGHEGIERDPVPTPDQVRVIFQGVVDQIEAYAKDHRTQVMLKVTADRSGLGWLIALGLVAYAIWGE